MFLFGSVLWEIPRREDARTRLVDVSADAPNIVELRIELARRDPEAYFDFGLEALLAGLDEIARR
jgi:hypothetical protein